MTKLDLCKKLLPECKKCIYYFQNPYIEGKSLCLKYGKTEWYNFEKVVDVRKDPLKCGPDGKYFIEHLNNYGYVWNH